jgi:tRNA/rRNA methyltransferase
MEQALADLRAALLDVGYLDPLNPDHILDELRRLIARAGPTPREVTLLRGLARQVGWAGRVARGGGTAP